MRRTDGEMMHEQRFWVVALLAEMLLVLTPVAQESASATPEDRLAQLFAKWDRPDAPGCSLAVVRDGDVVLQASFGSANLDHEVPNTSQTVFEIGSASKSVVSACIALLLDEGKIAPDDDVRNFIPELSTHETPIRIKHLIRCRSGTWDHWHAMQLAGWMCEPVESPYSEADALHFLAGQTSLPFEPGTKFKYGSGDYFLLGIVIRRVTGKSLAQFARERLFEPLGMTRTYFEVDSTRMVKGRATGYYRDVDDQWRQWTTHGGGIGGWGLKTCVDDLVRWNANFDQSRLPQGEYFDEFLKTGTLLENANVVDGRAGKSYRGLRRVQCTGGMPGFMAAMARFPEKKLTVICLANNSMIQPSKVAENIADLYLFDGPAPQPAEKQPESSDPVELSADQLRDKVGAWRSDYDFIFRVVLENDRLFFVHHFDQKYPMKPISASRFEPVGYPADGNTLAFHRDSPDQPYTLSLEWPAGKERYEAITLFRPTVRGIAGVHRRILQRRKCARPIVFALAKENYG